MIAKIELTYSNYNRRDNVEHFIEEAIETLQLCHQTGDITHIHVSITSEEETESTRDDEDDDCDV